MRARYTALGLALTLLVLGSCEREQKAIQQDLPAARASRARADAQQIARAVQLYQATFGTLPESLDALTRAQEGRNLSGGPFLASIPAPPAGWTTYQYMRQDESRFTIRSSGDGVTVTAP